jgi:hypothetical protein
MGDSQQSFNHDKGSSKLVNNTNNGQKSTQNFMSGEIFIEKIGWYFQNKNQINK